MTEFSFKTRLLNRARRLLMGRPQEELLRRWMRGHKVTDPVARLAPNHYQYAKPARRLVECDGIKYDLDISDLMEWHVYYGFQEEAHNRLISLCQPGATVIDVGTNIGFLLLRMAQAVGPEGQAIGFEPYPPVYAKCLRNIHLNDFKNIDLHPYALGAAKAAASLSVRDGRNLGKNSLSADSSPGDIPVNVLTLDEFIRKSTSEGRTLRPSLIKIDVEGHEMKVLAGARNVLLRDRPALFVEVDDANLKRHGGSAQALLAELRELDYDLTEAETGRPLPAEILPHFDVIARPRRKG